MPRARRFVFVARPELEKRHQVIRVGQFKSAREGQTLDPPKQTIEERF